MAPPRKPINPEQVFKLACIGCTQAEIGTILGCSVATLNRRYADPIKRGYANLTSSLRRAQFTLATGGNATMQIWLGKQLLHQRNEPSPTKTASLDDLLSEFRTINRKNLEKHGIDDGDS